MKGHYILGEGVKFNPIKCSISSEQHEVMLGSRETKMLELFFNHPNQVLNRAAITDYVWGALVVSETSLTKAISNLRKAFNHFGYIMCEIKTIPKEGYIFIFEYQGSSLYSNEIDDKQNDIVGEKLVEQQEINEFSNMNASSKFEYKRKKYISVISINIIISSFISAIVTGFIFCFIHFS